MLKVMLTGDWAFVDLKTGQLLCIGRKTEAEHASAAKLGAMVLEALSVAAYQELEPQKVLKH